MNFVKLTLSSNKLYVLINTERIIEFYADSDKDGLPCTKIVTDDGDYTTVTESLSQVLTAIGKAKGKEIPEEEPQQVPQEIITAAAEVIKNYCKEKVSCINCPFCSEEYECQIGERFPSRWDIPKGDE